MMKRVICLVLALNLIFSLVPPTAFAQETEPEVTVSRQEETPVTEISEEAPAESARVADREAPEYLLALSARDANAEDSEGIPDVTQTVTAPTVNADAATSGTIGETITWNLDENGKLTISGTGDIVGGSSLWSGIKSQILSVVIEEGITSVGDYAFISCTNMTDVTFPESLTAIGFRSFYSCTSLKSLRIPGSVTTIGEYAFINCNSITKLELCYGVTTIETGAFNRCESLTELILPESLVTIGPAAFQLCTSLAELDIPSSVTTIELGAFSMCPSLTKVEIPDTVTEMGGEIFWKCTGLVEVKLPKGLKVIGDAFFSNCTSLKKITFPEAPTTLGEDVFVICYGLTELDLPDTITSIGEGAFWYCDNLSKIDLPANLETLGYVAFAHCISLKTIHFPAKVSVVGPGAFPMCDNLMSFTLDGANPYLAVDDMGVLYNKDKTELIAYPNALAVDYNIPASVTTIGDYAFDRALVTGVTMTNNVTSIGKYAFWRCDSVKRLTLSTNLHSVGEYAFEQCTNMGTLVVSPGLTTVGMYAFNQCGIEKVEFLEGVSVIQNNLFTNCFRLAEVTLPSTLIRIEGGVFSRCTSLSEIVIPKNVSYIGEAAFAGCTNLKRVFFRGDLPELDGGVFADSSTTGAGASTPLNVDAIVYFRRDNPTWGKQETRDAIKAANTGIAGFRAYLEYDESYLDWGTCGDKIHWSLKKDGTLCVFPHEDEAEVGTVQGAMEDYTSSVVPWIDYLKDIRSIHVVDGVLNISDAAFSGCGNVTEISIAPTVSRIGDYAFRDCGKLTGLQLPEGVESLGRGVFLGCAKLTEISLPATLTQLGQEAFLGCKTLAKVELAAGNRHFLVDPEGVLYDITGKQLILVPSCVTGTYYVPVSVTSVGDHAFCPATGLEEIAFEGDCPEFGENAFAGAKLRAYYPVLNTTWKEDALQSYGGNVIWTPYDDTLTFGSDARIHTKTQNISLYIRPKEYRGKINDKLSFRDLENVVMHSSLADEVTAKDSIGFRIFQEEASRKDIVLEKNGYQDYVIPKAVSASFAALEAATTHNMDAYMKKKAPGKPYVSSVFGRESNQNQVYKDLTTQEMALEEGSRHDIIMTVAGAEGSRVEYVISQGGDRRISNYTGTFTYQNLYNRFDFDKTVAAYAVIDGKIYTESVELQIRKMQPMSQQTKDFLKNTKFSLIGKDGQAIEIPEDFPLVGGGKISLDALQFPLGIDVEGSRLRISFGVNVFGYEDGEWNKDAVWNDFKKEFTLLPKAENKFSEGIENGTHELDIYRTFKEKFSDEYYAYYDHNINFNVEFAGYLEADFINGTPVVKEIALNVAGVFTFKYTQQGAIWVVPAYFYVEMGASLSAAVTDARFLTDRDVPMELDLALGLEPKLRLGGGGGVAGAVSGGIYGEGSVPISLKFPDKYVQVKLDAEFGVEGQFFIFKGDLDLLSGEFVLVDKYLGDTETASASLLYSPAEDVSVTISSRDYTEKTSEWLGSGVSPHAITTGADFRTLQENVFNQSQPQIAALGDGLIMVWVEDAPARDTYNRMQLVYSLMDGETGLWSEPKPVSDDGHNDGYPSLVSDGTNAWVTWQKINKTLTEEDCAGIDVLLRSSEIFLAKISGQTANVESVLQLTDNTLYEYNAEVDLENGNPMVYYVSVAPDKVGTVDAHTLCRYSGSTGKTSNVRTGRNYLLSVVANNGQLAIVEDVDGNLGTTKDINVFSLGSLGFTAYNKGGRDVAYTWAGHSMMNGTKVLFASDMTNFYYRYNYASYRVLEYPRPISGNINILTGETGPIIVWSESVEDGDELYMVRFDGSAWSRPVRISNQGEALRDVRAALWQGAVVGVCNSDTSDGTDLNFFRLREFTDLELEDYVYFSESTAVPGQDQSFDVMLRNLGTETAQDVTFTVTDTLGTEHTVTQALSLAPGGFTRVTLTYPVPQDYTSTTLTVTAAISGKTDADITNNSVSLDIGKPDLVLREDSIHIVEGGYVVNLTVENAGIVGARNVTLDVMLEEGGERVHTRILGDLSRETYAAVNVSVPGDQLVFGEDGAARLYLTVKSSGEDASDVDNRLCLLFAKPVEKTCGHDWADADCENPKRCILCGITEGEKLDHKFENGSCIRCGDADPDYVNPDEPKPTDPAPTEPKPTEPKPTEPKPTEPEVTEPKPTEPKPTEPKPTEPKPTEPEAPKVEGVTRLAGADRLVTSYLVADQLKAKMGVEKFENIIVASGGTFADALPGSYLSAVKNAPILLTLAKDKYVNQTADYIKANLASGGTVYILGGESAVPASMEAALNGIKVQRVAGADRFGTNLAILKEAGVKAGDEILVCTAKEFADSLSASATGKPILLVYKKLTDEQKAYLSTLSGNTFCVVGGTTAVPDSIAKEVEAYGAVTRLAGKDRLETSTMVAAKYFADATTTVVAYGWNFPDGLCGGSLAYAMDAPLILAHSKEKLAKFTADYTTKAGLTAGYVLGGDGLVDDAATRAIFSMAQADPINILQ